ncbi:glycosyltransferase [Shimia sp. MMG029]|uniref:glycosyltransferase n=1 Tax=Shimia sp. MMG029 TaxID=3021978 RepID=UPI0022FE84F4|nr:glycosyltransferase [Shimia sp. MMG029]MDA5557674.1 glycosyltransferase [Shimia sp. MMG029]
MKSPKLTIVIISLNEEKSLPLLIRDLAAQSWSDFEIIHVDSNSDDNTLHLSETARVNFKDYRIVTMQRRGVSLGRNTGALHARGERLLFLDSDTRLASDFLENAMTELQDRQLDAGIVCMSADGLGIAYRVGFALFNAGICAMSFWFPTAVGACLFSTPELHHAIGGFDEKISLCEDCNYVLKAHHSKSHKTGVIKSKFRFDPRRLKQDGFLRTGFTYFRANLRRFFIGELQNQEIPYRFGHYG